MSDKQTSKAQQRLAEKQDGITKPQQAEATQTDADQQQPAEQATQPRPIEPDRVPEHRRCPWCWGRFQGVGRSYSVRGVRTYYRCQYSLNGKGSCGRTWTSDVIEDTEDVTVREIRRVNHE